MRSRRTHGFTLIELLAVVALFALLTAVALPNISLRSALEAMDAAKELGATIEFARQRAVMTGAPHRVALDLDAQRYQVERLVTGEDQERPDIAASWAEVDSLPLAAPGAGEAEYRPIDGPMGALTPLAGGAGFWSVELGGGSVDHGQVALRFERDGTSDHSEVWLVDPDGSHVVLTIEPLANVVQIARHAD